MRLQTADNSLGGKVQFTYTAKNLDPNQCPTTVCTATNQGDERRWRFPVTRTTINDGMGNQIVTDYAYQNPAMRGEYNQYGTLAASEFLGFKDSTARHFEIVAEGTTPNQEA